MAATNGPIKAQINAEVVEYYTFGQCNYICCKAQSFFIKQLMSCQLCALWIFFFIFFHNHGKCVISFSHSCF